MVSNSAEAIIIHAAQFEWELAGIGSDFLLLFGQRHGLYVGYFVALVGVFVQEYGFYAQVAG